ncbi:PHD-finger family protein [Histomonas meleagridis]|uniref:PHD-finger family protein n=1 Tax=Histomonas meleagridis TaxID=135588 RepID=UPI00355A7D38|nr:PHD-finger family protein [Histomonas meleagridis]KAH0804426.1 PHD-finger family protein [Histomonas meleagridis]
MKYNIPLIQCTKCKFWVHKYCENLGFGRQVHDFVCTKCGGTTYNFPEIELKNHTIPNQIVTIDVDRTSILSQIPEGPFKNMIISDLDKSELDFIKTIGKYFSNFIEVLFNRNHEFWKCFIDTFYSIFKIDKSTILSLMDSYAISFLYSNYTPTYSTSPTTFNNSDSIEDYLSTVNAPNYDFAPQSIELYVNEENKVCTPIDLDDGQFISDLPGFLMHTDEVDANDGIPLSCIAIINSDLIIDLDESSFNLAHLISRSFHFNTIAKLYKVNNQIRVGLFATHLKGPYVEEKSKSTHAIISKSQIILPLDGEIPFFLPKVEWRERKVKQRHRNTQPRKPVKRKVEKQPKKPEEPPVVLNLLSAFVNDIIPPLPYSLLTEQEIEQERQKLGKIRTRAHNRKFSADET